MAKGTLIAIGVLRWDFVGLGMQVTSWKQLEWLRGLCAVVRGGVVFDCEESKVLNLSKRAER